MTLQTPLHLQRRGLVNDRHVVNASMTSRTTHTFFYVNAVIEVGVIGKIVDAYPFDRFSSAETRAHGFEVWTISPNLFVTVHARRRGR